MGCGCGKNKLSIASSAPAKTAPMKRVELPAIEVMGDPDPVWIYQVTADSNTKVLSEWNTAGEAVNEARRVDGKAHRIKRS